MFIFLHVISIVKVIEKCSAIVHTDQKKFLPNLVYGSIILHATYKLFKYFLNLFYSFR